jgi:hypothetical protein
MNVPELFACLRRQRAFPAYRDKDIKTAITRYLAPAFGVSAEELTDLATIRTTYKSHLHAYFPQCDISPNMVNNIKNQLSCLFRAADRAGLIPQQRPTQPVWPDRSQQAIMAEAGRTSPYRHRIKLPAYRRRVEQWPEDMREHWLAYTEDRAHELRPITIHNLKEHLEAYVGYALKVDRLPAMCWDDLFDERRLKRFAAWHAKRVGEQRCSAYAHNTICLVARLAKHEKRPDAEGLHALTQQYQRPPRMHNKQDPVHAISRAELDKIACSLISDGRRPLVKQPPGRQYPGLRRAILFQTGLILRLMLRVPLRQRGIREMRLGQNLYRLNGGWVLHYNGDQLKVSLRKGKPNTFHIDFPQDLIPELEEFLHQVRPKFPQASEQPYVFLTNRGTPHTRDSLYGQITTHLYVRSGKRIFPHLLRSFFFSEGVATGKDINFLSAVMNIDPVVALRNYHEIKAGETLKALDEFNRLTLT